MKPHARSPLALIFAGLLGAVPFHLGAEESLLAADDFSAPSISSHWTWLREDAAGWRLGKGKLSIRTNGALWSGENTQRNVLLHEPLATTDTALAIELTVDGGLALTDPYEHGGLIWYFDDDHWVTLTQLNHVQDQTQKIMLVHETGGRGQDPTAKAVPYTARRVELRLEHRGAEFTGYYRQPGSDTWQRVGTIEFEHSGPTPRIGLIAGQGRPSLEHWVDFDDFRVVALP